ncbi:hypothetical protein ACFLY2_03390 [Patescibacteria group bacterium]
MYRYAIGLLFGISIGIGSAQSLFYKEKGLEHIQKNSTLSINGKSIVTVEAVFINGKFDKLQLPTK